MEQNKVFSQMKQAALARLVDHDPKEIAAYASASYDGIFRRHSLSCKTLTNSKTAAIPILW